MPRSETLEGSLKGQTVTVLLILTIFVSLIISILFLLGKPSEFLRDSPSLMESALRGLTLVLG